MGIWTSDHHFLIIYSIPGFLLDDRVGGADCAEDEEEGTEHKLGVVQTFGLGSES